MVDWTQYFGATLVTKEGKKSVNEVLSGKARVGLYFSAHWCPPCRGFTPVLAEFYNDLVQENDKDLVIVFVSSDSDEKTFQEYYGTMPWVSIPFVERSIAQALGTKFEIRGIPAFIVLDGVDGSVLDTDGRSTVSGAKADTSKALSKWVIK